MKNNLLDYSIQLAMLTHLKRKNLINESEFQKIKSELMKDYNVVSDFTA